MKLQLLCKNCKNTMHYQPRNNDLKGKTKKCVYCGKNFNVRNSVLRQI